MNQRKICLLGAFSVGKTSLIRRFVESVFDERYLTTVGVKIDKKVVDQNGSKTMLMIWDLAGEDDFSALQTSYLRGAAGLIIVVDATRPNTLDTALSIQDRVQDAIGTVPSVVALNKADIEADWLLEPATLERLEANDNVLRTSARTGQNVEALFGRLTEAMA